MRHTRVSKINIMINRVHASKFSEAAAIGAIGVAKKCGILLVTVSVSSSETELDAAQYNVQKVIDVAKKEGVSSEAMTMIGKPYEAIVEASRQKHVDLIIVGSHGRAGLERLLMGSVAERVIDHSETAC